MLAAILEDNACRAVCIIRVSCVEEGALKCVEGCAHKRCAHERCAHLALQLAMHSLIGPCRRALEESHMNLERAVDKLLTRPRPATATAAGKPAKASVRSKSALGALGARGSTIDVLFAKKARKK